MTSSNNKGTLLNALAQSPHQWVQLATVALVALTGFANWAATQNSGDRSRHEIEEARRANTEGQQRIKDEVVRQVAEIHSWLKQAQEEFHAGNADSANNRKILLAFKDELAAFETRQLAALDNQTAILKNQSAILQQLHQFMSERKKQLEGQ